MKQIFADARREDVSGAEYPFILSLETGCTGFVVDAKKMKALTASHCSPAKDVKVCLAPDDGNWPTTGACPHIGKIESLDQGSWSEDRDFTLFTFSLADKYKPSAAIAVNDDPRLIPALFANGTAIEMIGYPSDDERKGELTRSKCVVRSDSFDHNSDPGIISLTTDLLKDVANWSTVANLCSGCVGKEVTIPNFYTDCSVYGGNSGGPIMFQGVVIGMPKTYYPSPTRAAIFVAETNSRRAKCRDIVTKMRPQAAQLMAQFCASNARLETFANWNSLDRSSTDLRDFPKAIAAHSWGLTQYKPANLPQNQPDQAKAEEPAKTEEPALAEKLAKPEEPSAPTVKECPTKALSYIGDKEIYCARFVGMEGGKFRKIVDREEMKPEKISRLISHILVKENKREFTRTGLGVIYGSWSPDCKVDWSEWHGIDNWGVYDMIVEKAKAAGSEAEAKLAAGKFSDFTAKQILYILNAEFRYRGWVPNGASAVRDCQIGAPESQ